MQPTADSGDRAGAPLSAVRSAVVLDWAGFCLALVLFAILGLWNLNLPGLYQDEALDVAPAARLLKGYAPWPYSLFPTTLALPLMVGDHVGPTSTYLMLPFLRVLGIGVPAVRLYEFSVGVAGLLLVFLWARRALTPGTAWIAALLLAAMPSFWLACRNGLHVSFIVVAIAAGALICLDRWRRDNSTSWLYAGSFLLGVGFSTKILFIWFLAALVAGMLIAPRGLLRRISRRQKAVNIVCFAAGCAPFLLFVLLSRGLILRTIASNLTHTPYGVKNSAVLANMLTQLHSFTYLLDGSWLAWTGVSPHNPVALPLFLLASTYLVVRWRDAGTGLLRFSLLATVVIVFASCFTISTLGPKHLVILLPFPTVLVAAAVGKAWSWRRRPSSLVVFSLLVTMAAAQLGWDLADDRRYLMSLAATQGVGMFSSAHGELTEYLLAEGVQLPMAGDWGFDSNLETLSQGRVRVRQIFDLTEPPPYAFTRRQTQEALRSPESVFLFHAESIAAAPGRFVATAAVAKEMGVRLALAATFRDGRGEPVALVYRASPAKPARTAEGVGDHLHPALYACCPATAGQQASAAHRHRSVRRERQSADMNANVTAAAGSGVTRSRRQVPYERAPRPA